MEGKKVFMMSGLLVVVVLGQIQGGAAAVKSCCPNATARSNMHACRSMGTPLIDCARAHGCGIVDYNSDCPAGLTDEILQNTSSVNEYCKLGCVSSVCGAITTLRHSDASEVVNGAVEKCTDACSAFCTKGAVESA